MFGWFKPQCPVDEAAKDWIESRLIWLSKEFGRDVFVRRAVILPTNEFFPDPIDGTEDSIRNLLDQVCAYMDVNPNRVDMRLYTNKDPLGLVNDSGKAVATQAAGLYQGDGRRTLIQLDTNGLFDLPGLVGTMAHELSHLRLMGERRVTGREFDNELLTDLTALFHGFGIFLGNLPRHWDGNYGTWPGTQLKRPEYMTLPMFAYALAHTAWHRKQPKPDWYPFLSFDLKPCFKQGVKFLTQTGNSKFIPLNIV